jgi:hypothetical protein
MMAALPGQALKGFDSATGSKLYSQSGAKKLESSAKSKISEALYPAADTPAQLRQDLQQVQEVSAQQRRSRSSILSS